MSETNTVKRMKRAVDISISLLALAVVSPFIPLIALAIRLDSQGPVLFRQMRIGTLWSDRSEIFYMLKFRSMYVDAESKTGPTWATKDDPRITRVGRFLRKTRLDEIPQLLNVLKGDMSIIGPRPERPGFYRDLEQAIPFFADRTYGVKPGITGLAQVSQGYDTCVEDVRSKVGFDHAYAVALSSPLRWVQMDLWVAWRTLFVMVGGRGQ